MKKMVMTNNFRVDDDLLKDNTKPFRDFIKEKKGELVNFDFNRRRWLQEILDKLLVYEDPQLFTTVIQLGAETETVPKDLDDLPKTIRLLLLEAGYRNRMTDQEFGSINYILSTWIREFLQKKQSRSLSLGVEIKNISDKEELYGNITRIVKDQFKIRTFMKKTKNGQKKIGVYCFNGIIYEPCELTLRNYIRSLADTEEVSKKITRWVVGEVLSRIEDETLEELKYEPLKIAFKNGIILDWELFKDIGSLRDSIEEPSPDKIVFHLIPHRLALEKLENLEGLAKYDEGIITNIEELAGKLCPTALRVFKEWVGDSWVQLFEVIGYTLYPKCSELKKSIMLIGKRDSGKSTYIKLIEKILGEENVSHESLQDLTDPNKRFVYASLYQKLANTHGDLEDRPVKEPTRFKKITGCDGLPIERKFRDKFSAVLYAKLIYGTNKLPVVKKMGDAFTSRWLLIRFINQFPRQDNWLEETFTEDEIEGIIIVSLIAFRNVLKRGSFSHDRSTEEIEEEWKRMSNSVYAFIQDLLAGKMEEVRLVKDPNGNVNADELYNLYLKYFEDYYEVDSDEAEPVSRYAFTKRMKELGFKVGTGRKRYYIGLRLIKEESLDIDSSPLFRRED